MTTTRCPTTSGIFQCEKDINHLGECECEASPYAIARLPRVTLPGPPPTVPPKAEEPAK